MSCGCKQPVSTGAATIAAMCQTCPAAVRDKYGSAVECTYAKLQILTIATTGVPCPIGRFDSHGAIRWWGVEWIGVPEPLRWVLTWKLKRSPRNLDGCGCIKAVKESWVGKYLEPWLEGIALLRARFASALSEFAGTN